MNSQDTDEKKESPSEEDIAYRRAYAKMYYHTHTLERRAYYREYYKKHKEEMKAKREAKKEGVPTPAVIDEKTQRQKALRAARNKRYYESHKEQISEYNKQYKEYVKKRKKHLQKGENDGK